MLSENLSLTNPRLLRGNFAYFECVNSKDIYEISAMTDYICRSVRVGEEVSACMGAR